MRYSIEEYRAAMLDFTKAIEQDPNYAAAYSGRGDTKMAFEDYRGAVSDYTIAIELDPEWTINYLNRGLAKFHLGNKDGGCLDFSTAGKRGDVRAYEAIRQYCN